MLHCLSPSLYGIIIKWKLYLLSFILNSTETSFRYRKVLEKCIDFRLDEVNSKWLSLPELSKQIPDYPTDI